METKYQRQVTEKEAIEANLAAATETIELLQQDQVVRRDQILDLVEKAAAVSTELEEAKAPESIAPTARPLRRELLL